MRILVLNCFSRNSLAVINSLDPSYELFGGTQQARRSWQLKLERLYTSPRLSGVFRYRDPVQDQEGFAQDVAEACRRLRPQAVIPTGTNVTNALSAMKQVIAAQTPAKILVEDHEKLSLLADKWRTYQLASQLGVPVPASALVSRENLAEVRALRPPLVAKPRLAFASRGVEFLADAAQREEFLTRLLGQPGAEDSYMIQEQHPGELHDVTSCSKAGRPVSLMSQHRLMGLRDFGGGGVINQTTDEPEMRGYASRIIGHLGWNGVLEFDFIKGPRGYALIECNPKIWGTTELTVKAGLNVCQQLVDLFVLEKDLPPCPGYRVGLVYKWIFPECVWAWFLPPRQPRAIWRRMVKTLRRYPPGPAITSLRAQNLRHMVGIAVEKSGG